MTWYNKAPRILEGLAARDPSNPDSQRDLIISLVALGGTVEERSYLERALNIALLLSDSGKMPPADEWMLDELRRMLAQ